MESLDRNIFNSFIVEDPQSTTTYGGKQQDYLERSGLAVETCVTKFQAAVKTKQDLKELFFNTMEHLAEVRGQIALDHKTEEAEKFGIARSNFKDMEIPWYSNVMTTMDAREIPLEGKRTYNDILVTQFHSHMVEFGVPSNEITHTKSKTPNKKVAGQNTNLTVEIIPRKGDPRAYTLGPIDIEEKKLAPLFGEAELISDQTSEVVLNNLFESAEKTIQLKKKDKELYNKLNFALIHLALIGTLFSRTNSYDAPSTVKGRQYQSFYSVLATLKLEAEGVLYPVGRWLAAMKYDRPKAKGEPDELSDLCFTEVIHADPFHVPIILKEISKIFEKAMLWNKETDSLAELKIQVGLFRLYYGLCMPHFRGDGAIGDWFELAIYIHHGFTKTRQVKGCLTAYVPLSSLTVAHFLKRYVKTIDVKAPAVKPASVSAPAPTPEQTADLVVKEEEAPTL